MYDVAERLEAGQWYIKAAEAADLPQAIRAQERGADLIVLYHTTVLGIDKVAGLLPYGNSNDIVASLAASIAPEMLDIPLYAGVCCSEPLRRKSGLLSSLFARGVRGVQNFPTIGMADGTFRYNMEAVHFGYAGEVEQLHNALELGLSVLPYVFNQSEAIQMAFAGAGTLIFHLGLPGTRPGRDACVLAHNYLERIRTFRSALLHSHPRTRILAYTPDADVMAVLDPLLRQEKLVDGIFSFLPAERAQEV